MRLTALQPTDDSASALVRRLYPGLSERQRHKTEAELLKLNPHLAEVSAFRPGTVVRLPEGRGLAPRADPIGDDPVGDDPIVDTLGLIKDGLAAFRELQAGRFDAELADLANQGALLKNREVAEAIRNSPEAGEIASALAAHLRQGEEQLALEKRNQEVLFAKIAEDLDALFR